MNRNESGDWLRYKRETYRYGLYNRRLPLLLLFNVVLVVFFGSLLLLIFEKDINPGIKNYGDAAWCMFVSMATIGYGDIVPITVGGRIVVLVSMILGIGALSTYITALATRRVAKTKRRYSGLQDKTKSSNHIVICGWNSRGAHVIERLGVELAGQHRPIVLLADLEDKPVEDEKVPLLPGQPGQRERSAAGQRRRGRVGHPAGGRVQRRCVGGHRFAHGADGFDYPRPQSDPEDDRGDP